MLIIDCLPGETEAQAEARVRAQVDRAEAVTGPTEVERLAAEPGAEAPPPVPEYVDDEDETVREGWHIDDLDGLNWSLRRMGELETEVAENQALAQREIDRLMARVEKLNRTAAHGIAFFRGRIAEYAQAHRDELLKGGKKKSRTLPCGTVGWRKSGGGLAVTDGEALLEWARKQPPEAEVLRIREEPALKAIKAHFETTGELPDGMEQLPEGEEIQIKPVLPAKEA